MAQIADLLTTAEVAKRLRVTPETVRAWVRRGLIPALRLSPKVLRYDPDAVLAAMAALGDGGVPRAE